MLIPSFVGRCWLGRDRKLCLERLGLRRLPLLGLTLVYNHSRLCLVSWQRLVDVFFSFFYLPVDKRRQQSMWCQIGPRPNSYWLIFPKRVWHNIYNLIFARVHRVIVLYNAPPALRPISMATGDYFQLTDDKHSGYSNTERGEWIYNQANIHSFPGTNTGVGVGPTLNWTQESSVNLWSNGFLPRLIKPRWREYYIKIEGPRWQSCSRCEWAVRL